MAGLLYSDILLRQATSLLWHWPQQDLDVLEVLDLGHPYEGAARIFGNQYKNDINDNIICDYEDFKYQGFEEDEKLIEQSMKSYEKEIELYDERSKEKLHLEQELNDKLAKSSQIEKYQKYEDQMTDFHSAALEKDQNKMIENHITKSQLESEIESLTEKIGDKETALDLRRKFEEIHTELGRKLEEKLGVEKIKTNLGSLSKKFSR